MSEDRDKLLEEIVLEVRISLLCYGSLRHLLESVNKRAEYFDLLLASEGWSKAHEAIAEMRRVLNLALNEAADHIMSAAGKARRNGLFSRLSEAIMNDKTLPNENKKYFRLHSDFPEPEWKGGKRFGN